MVKFLIYFKRKFPFVWVLIEWFNGILFRLFFHQKITRNANKILSEYASEIFTYRFLTHSDLEGLHILFQNQDQEQFRYFKPHSFDEKTLYRLFKNPSFYMFGVFEEEKMIGYFFLRCFFNGKSFIGRLVDGNYQGKGLGKIMGKILYDTAWLSSFKVFSTISIYNLASFNSHKANQNLKIVKELPNSYYLVEFVKPKSLCTN